MSGWVREGGREGGRERGGERATARGATARRRRRSGPAPPRAGAKADLAPGGSRAGRGGPQTARAASGLAHLRTGSAGTPAAPKPTPTPRPSVRGLRVRARVRVRACARTCAPAHFGEGRKKEGAAAWAGTVHWRAAAAAAAQAAGDGTGFRECAGGRGRAGLGGVGRGCGWARAEEGKRGQRESCGAPLSGAHPNHTMAPMLCGENTTRDLSFRPKHQHKRIKIRMSIKVCMSISIRSNNLHSHNTRCEMNKILASHREHIA